MKVSVIIPVYNAASYLRQCLGSLINQTLRDIEIICVEDCSTDNSYEILKEYKCKDNRISIIANSTNQGAGVSRNKGIKKATGEYLSILDADDFFENDMLEVVYSQCKLADADIGIYNYRMYDNRTQTAYKCGIPLCFSDKLRSENSIFDIFKPYLLTAIVHFPWNKIYKTKFVENVGIEFQHLKYMDDTYFCSMILVAAKKVIYVDKAFVYYRVNTLTQTSNNCWREPLAPWMALMEMKKFLISRNFFKEYEQNFIEFVMYFLIFSLSSLNYENQKQLYNFLQDKGLVELGLAQCSQDSFRFPFLYKQWEIIKYDSFNENTVLLLLGIGYNTELFNELKKAALRCFLWGFGKYGKAFLYECKQSGYKLNGIIDQDPKKRNIHVDEYIIQSFEDIDCNEIDAVIITNPNFGAGIVEKMRQKNIKIIDVGAYWKFGIPFKECIY